MADPFIALEVIGTVAFAASGSAVAIRAGMDWLGVIVLAMVTAVGGGTLRDLLLGHVPVFWMEHPWPLAVALATAVVVIIIGSRSPHQTIDSLAPMLIADAIGLAAFTVNGTQISIDAGESGINAVILGVLTGAGGGVIRDVLASQRPLILIGQIYALAAIAGSSLIVALEAWHVPGGISRALALVLILSIRLAALRWNWALPRFTATPQDPSGEESTRG